MFTSNPSTESASNTKWLVCQRKIPKEEVIYFAQVILIYVVVLACIVNISIGDDVNHTLWSSLLSGCLGYMLPNPTIVRSSSKKRDVALLRNAPEQQFDEVLSGQHTGSVHD